MNPPSTASKGCGELGKERDYNGLAGANQALSTSCEDRPRGSGSLQKRRSARAPRELGCKARRAARDESSTRAGRPGTRRWRRRISKRRGSKRIFGDQATPPRLEIDQNAVASG